MALDKPQALKPIIKALAAIFAGGPASLDQFTTLELGTRLHNLAPAAEFDVQVFNAVLKLDELDRVPELVQALFREKGGHPAIGPIIPFFPDIAPPSPQPAGAVKNLPTAPLPAEYPIPRCLFGSHYVIDREDTWKYLTNLAKPLGPGDPNVALILGGPRTGKSLVADLLAHLCAHQNHHYVEAKYRHIRAEPGPVLLANHWLSQIYPKLGLAQPKPFSVDPTNPANHPHMAATAVLSALSSTKDPWWLVFDGPDSQRDAAGTPAVQPIPQPLADFFDILCDNIAVSHRHVRLVLIGVFPSQLSTHRAGITEVCRITYPHVEALFRHICQTRNPPAEEGVAEDLAKYVWDRVAKNNFASIEPLYKEVENALKLLESEAGA